MKKILFPTDFSKAAKNGFQFALNLAKDIGAELDVVSVYSVNFGVLEEIPKDYIDEMIEDRMKDTQIKLDLFVEENAPNFKGEKIIIFGAFIPEEINALVRKSFYDLVIMGTKGERNAFEKMMGSITTRTIMNAPCPVLAIPIDAAYQGIQAIAYATDFKPSDTVALGQLMYFSKRFNAKLSFVHVDTVPDIGEIKDTISLQNYPYEFSDFSIVNNSSVEKGLDNFIESQDIDLLALFIPKRRLWERLFHSSFSKQYTFHSKVPLLVFHE